MRTTWEIRQEIERGTMMDITARRRSEDTLHFLARVSEVLATSLDYGVNLRQVAALTVWRVSAGSRRGPRAPCAAGRHGAQREPPGRAGERAARRVPHHLGDRHYGGLGMGLWIAREIVTAMGGSLQVESTPGQRATFTVELPRVPVPE